jgi:tetratricopeptide repeat protein
MKILEEGATAIDPKTGEGAARLFGFLADVYAERGGPEKALLADSLYLRAIEANPKEPDVLNNYAYRLAKAGRNLDEAERYALQAVRLSPDAAHILDTYAYILLLRKNYTLAKLYQRKALSQAGPEKTSPDMYDHMGDIYRGLGEYAEAIEAWQQALKSLAERENKDEKADKAERIRIEKKINEAKQAQKK